MLEGLGCTDGGPSTEWTLHGIAERFDLVITGVGKANAAGAVARCADPRRHAGVLSVGLAGALPIQGPPIGSVVAATACVYADEGLLSPQGFTDCAAMGFPLGPFEGNSPPVSQEILDAVRSLCDATGAIATVSTCSGTDAQAGIIAGRTGAIAEAMEGAAVAHAAARLEIPGAELRVISNTTGDRARQRWDLALGLRRLRDVIGLL